MKDLHPADRLELERLGFKRWTKEGMDRMYIDAFDLGLRIFYDEKIQPKEASMNDVVIPLTRGLRLKEAKTYLDLATMTIISVDELLAKTAADLIHEAIGATYEANAWDRRIKLTLDNPEESC